MINFILFHLIHFVCVVCDVWCMVCDVCCVVLCRCHVVLCCVEVHGVVCCCSVRAGGVLFKTRTQYQGVLGIILAKCPNTVLG